jgi:hypothetical protein
VSIPQSRRFFLHKPQAPTAAEVESRWRVKAVPAVGHLYAHQYRPSVGAEVDRLRCRRIRVHHALVTISETSNSSVRLLAPPTPACSHRPAIAARAIEGTMTAAQPGLG